MNNEPGRMLDTLRRIFPDDATTVQAGPDDASISTPGAVVCVRPVEPRALSVDELGMLHQERLDLLEQMFVQASYRAKHIPSPEDKPPQEVGFEIAMSTYREWLSMARGRCGTR